MRALLVDDERFSINTLEKVIPWREIGIDSLLTAGDGQEGWELYREHSPDLVVTDVSMPRMNGIELVRRIREVDTQIPVVILSGYDEFDYAKEALLLKVSHYLLKPVVHAEVVPILRQVMDEAGTTRRQRQYAADMQRKLQEALPVLQEQFIFDLISGKVKRSDELRQKLDFLRIDPALTEGGLVMSLELHRLGDDKTSSEHDWHLYKYAASNIAQEVIDLCGGGHVVRYVDDRLPLLLFGGSEAEVRSRAAAAAAAIIENVAHYLGIPSNIGIGRYISDCSRYIQSHTESKQALLSSTMAGFERTAFYEETGRLAAGFEFGVEEIEQLVQALLKGERGVVLLAWKPLEDRLVHGSDRSLPYMMMVCSGFLIGITLQLAEETELADELRRFIQLEDMYGARTKEALLLSVKETLLALHDYLAQRHGEHKYIEQIKQYVAAHYRSELTVADIARELHLSRTYISKLFKRETGDSITGYIVKFRIGLAKKLMDRHRGLMIYEISARVGYADQNYFCRVFKNVTGLRPSEYLERARRGRRG